MFSGLQPLLRSPQEISNLADTILDVSLSAHPGGLVRRYGTPRYTDSDGSCASAATLSWPSENSVARELNYSSDIDLMFIYSENGETDGANPITETGVFQEGLKPLHRAAVHLHLRRHVLSRRSSAAARWHVWAKFAFRSTARRNTTRPARATGNCRCSSRRALPPASPRPGGELLESAEPLNLLLHSRLLRRRSRLADARTNHEKLAARRSQR